MSLGVLGRAWVAAEASLTLGWQLVGVWRDQDAPGQWQAVASGATSADAVTRKGEQPHIALSCLAEARCERRWTASG